MEIRHNARYTTMQLCRLLGVSKGTIRNWRLKGLKYHIGKYNGRTFYLGNELAEFIKSEY